MNSLSDDLSWIDEHSLILRDADNHTVLMYSPYASNEKIIELDGKKINNFKITVRNESIYGVGTNTIVAEDLYPDKKHREWF